YDAHSERVVLTHAENHDRNSIRLKREKVIVNDREGKTMIYPVPERRLMRVLQEIFLGAEEIVH
ncbi:MAG: hypothetical protein PHE22_07320, partial [Mesotoga sp.]|nr:hypothetical protein [Mesotoga sp.]